MTMGIDFCECLEYFHYFLLLLLPSFVVKVDKALTKVEFSF